MKKYIYIYFITLAFISCERIIPFSPEDTDPKMTVYSLASATGYGVGFGVMTNIVDADPIDAVVSRSVGILDNSNPIFLDAATLWVVDNNTSEVDTLVSLGGGGRYRAPNMKVITGHTYNLFGKETGLDEIFATSTVPNLPTDITVIPRDTSLGSGGGPGGDKPSISFDLEIDDDGEPGYYMIEAYQRPVDSISVPKDMMEIESDDPSFVSIGSRRSGKNRLYVSNNLFLGEKRTFDIRVSESRDNPVPFSMQKVFKIVKMDNGYYNYLSSFDLYQDSRNPFTQPVTVYSNITNGLGVFSGTSAMWIAP